MSITLFLYPNIYVSVHFNYLAFIEVCSYYIYFHLVLHMLHQNLKVEVVRSCLQN